MDRRSFLALLSAAGLSCAGSPESLFAVGSAGGNSPAGYAPARIPNEYSLFLPGEREALANAPAVSAFTGGGAEARLGGEARLLRPGESLGGWQLLCSVEMNGVETAVFEKHVRHRGAIAYVTARGGTIAMIPKGIGDLAQIKPRPVANPVRLTRNQVPGPDTAGDYILRSTDDPCYENVAALGREYIGWSLVANEEAGPLRSIYLEADGTSRQPARNAQVEWAPDLEGPLFDPERFVPFDDPQKYRYEHGYSKRTLLGGYLPVANTGVWNATYNAGYEVTMLLPPGAEATPIARVRVKALEAPHRGASENNPHGPAGAAQEYQEHYWNCDQGRFFSELAGVWNRWHHFYEDSMPVEIPDGWLLDAARAGITLSRCSYRGLEPTYQVGEGAYTKIPERSHALFPVAAYEFIWAQQLWGLTAESDPYFTYYLNRYILPDGNFLYNTQDQVEAPLNAGIFLMNAARAYAYTGDLAAFEARLPTLERMLSYVLARYEYGKEHYPLPDRRYGLIWGSPEADLGEPYNDFPNSHPFYFQNATCTWRGLLEHARALAQAAAAGKPEYGAAAARYQALAEEMRTNIERSLAATIAAGDPAMRAAGITPFEPNDTVRRPTELSSYENHRFMEDFFLASWGDGTLDRGHLKHRAISGDQILGMNTDGNNARTSNFMSHGTLAAHIRQEDYRPFLLVLYALVCYAADSGNRYAPEDAYIPGSYPGEQSPYGWSAVINSTLQPTLGLRWLLCYEEPDQPLCHLQKGAPKHWFAPGERIVVRSCPTRFGSAVSWTTEARDAGAWHVTVEVGPGFAADIALHIHPPEAAPLRTASAGTVQGNTVLLPKALLAQSQRLEFSVS